MGHIFTLKNTARAFLLAGLIWGMPGVMHAQLGGAGQVGGMGEQGAPAGEFPGQGSAIGQFPPKQQGGITTVEPGKKAPPQDSSNASRSGQPPDMEPGAARGPIPPIGPITPQNPAGSGGY